jgi:hypothetical protein
MRFRFTISRSDKPIDPLPSFETWQNRGLPDRIAWTIGTSPTVDLPSTGAFDQKISDELFTSYNFIPGEEYTITVEYTRVMNDSHNNPRHLRLYIYSDLFVLQHQTTDTTPVPPPDSITRTFSLTFTADINCKKIALYYASGSDVTVTLNDIDSDVTLTDLDSYQINEPDGWRDCILKLERDKLFHSLIEHFEGSFIFYGSNGRINGGYHILKEWDLQDGPDADITLLIEYSDNDIDFYEVFSGQLDMSLAEWMIDHKVRIPIIKDNFWATFMNRKETPVNLIAAQDLDSEDVEELVDDITIDLPSQKIRYNGQYNWMDTFTYYESEDLDLDTAIVAQLDWDETVIDDLRKFNIPRALIPIGDNIIWDVVTGIFEAPWDGDYTFDVRTESAYYDEVNDLWVPSASLSNSPTFRIGIVGASIMDGIGFGSADPNTVLTNTNVTYGSDEITVSTYSQTLKLFKGQQVAIWGRPGVGAPVDTPDNLTVFGERRLVWRDVRLATTANITLSGEQLIDGEMTSADRILVRNQADSSQNGVWVSGAGAWTRATDSDSPGELYDAAVYVSEGDVNIGSGWKQINEEIELGFTSVTWVYIIPNDERLRPYPGGEVDNHFNVTADTTFRKTRTTGFLLHDAAAAILKHYGLGQVNPFYSEVLGSDRTLARQYESNGCFWPYGLTRGLQLRGYSLAEKSFALSFMEWWEGADPIFNLGLGYESLPGSVIEPEVIEVAALPDWEDAAGPNPGSWTYTSPAVPHTSVNGSGGVSGYTKGDVATLAGQIYSFSFVLEILDSGLSGEISEVTVAILDGSDNEIETIVFNYTDAGFKFETFTLTPTTAGTSVALRITNNTPFDTKTFYLRYFVGGQANQFLANPDFSDVSEWFGDGTGFPWVITGGAATLDLPSGVSERLIDTFTGAGTGRYLLVIRRTSTNFTAPTDSANFAVQVFDQDDNILDGSIEFITGNNTTDVSHTFTTAGIPAKVKMLMEVGTGADMNVSVDFVMLYGPSAVDSIITLPETRIRVEKMEYFYDPEPVVYLSNIRDITRRYDTEKIYKKILIGYKQWKTEDISGIDDPQTKHTYATQLKKSGEEIEVLSDFIGASLAIEQARRQSIDKSTDYQFDDATFIIALNSEEESASPDAFVPELDENFTVINNLLNSETRYNIRITPARNFLRNINKFNIGLQSYIGSLYRFTRGEGNYDVETTMLSSCDEEDYGGALLGEGYNLQVTSDAVHSPYYYEISYKLSLSEYRSISANKNKAIGVSQTDFGHIPFFIDTLSYQMAKGELQISGWTKVYWDITSILGIPPTQDCTLLVPCENPITDEMFNELADEEGNCIVWTL